MNLLLIALQDTRFATRPIHWIQVDFSGVEQAEHFCLAICPKTRACSTEVCPCIEISKCDAVTRSCRRFQLSSAGLQTQEFIRMTGKRNYPSVALAISFTALLSQAI